MKSYVLTPAAIQDLQSICDYLERENPAAARRVLVEVRAAMRKLAKQPGIGHMREDLADRSHRFFLVYSYFVVYITGTAPLRVVRVLHAARDVQSLMGQISDED